jgi:hypothetical protein
MTATAHEEVSGQLALNRYRIVRPLAQGGMGVVSLEAFYLSILEGRT